jgi:hypothetical protein
MKGTIWFDMDGTIANLYAVTDWLPKLRASDPSPYAEAKVLLNMAQLAKLLHKVQAIGYTIGIISWMSKGGTESYDEAVKTAKLNWLEQHLKSVQFDFVNIVKYGTPKTDFIKTESDILFDDESRHREAWTGEAYIPSQILPVLKELVARG